MDNHSRTEQIMLDIFEMSVECQEEVTIVDTVENTSSLSNGMHSPHRSSNINGLDTRVAGSNRTDSRTASWVISHHKLLKRNVALLSNCFQERRGNQISGIPLIVIHLDNNTFIDFHCMVVLMLWSIVRVDCMGHVCWNKEWVLNCFLEAITRYIFTRCENFVYSVNWLEDDRWACSLSWIWATLFVIEQEGHVYGSSLVLNFSHSFQAWIKPNLQCQEE